MRRSADKEKLRLSRGAVGENQVPLALADIQTVEWTDLVRHAARADEAGVAEVENTDRAPLEECRSLVTDRKELAAMRSVSNRVSSRK